ncbi:DUF3616 domain-containing protein [Methylobacterium sp. BTF04]|nr:DUF3616 domain-containing protein [Methylobacterium sp. BTF04]
MAEALQPVGPPYAVSGDLAGKTSRKGKIKWAEDISGIACRPDETGPMRCLVVNDENTGAQFVAIDGTTLIPGAEVDLVGRAPSRTTLGAAPTTGGCTLGQGEYGEMDGEAVAYAAPNFYVTGSHGCSRRGREYKMSTFVLARIRPNAAGTGAEAVETTYRLGDALKNAETVGAYFLKDLEARAGGTSTKGLNVEGLAVAGGRLYAGLRAPNLDGKAFLVSVGVEALFAPGTAALAETPRVIPLDVGADAGIRDLSVLPDGTLLVLTGPAENGLAVPYRLFAFEIASGKLTSVGTFAALEGEDAGGKAEAMVRLGPGRLLMLFDSLKNGGPRAYAVPIR